MRKKTKLFIWIAAGSFIAYILLQWGMNITGRAHRSPIERGIIAEVNGEPISSFDYQREIERFSKEQAERLEGAELNEEMMEVIRERAFDALIARKLVEQEVRRKKIAVTDEEILNIVRYSPPQEFLEAEEFQTEGGFDYDKYHEFIRDPQSFSFLIDYERRIRESLPVQKIQLLVLSSAKITDWQVRKEYSTRNEEVKVEYVLVRPDPTQTVEVSQEEISEYYAAHEEELLEPEKAVISYVFFEMKPSEEDEQLAKERIEEVYDEAVSGADFTELAQYYSDDPGSASKGGDLGWFTEGTMVKEFDDVVFSLKTGQISEPFRTSYGWHIAKIDGRKKNEVRASHILLKITPSMQTLEEVRNSVREFMTDSRSVGFEEAAAKHTMHVNSTEEFSLDREYIPGLGFFREVHRFILENGVGEVSYPIAKGNGYYVVKITRKKSRRLPDLEEVSVELEKRIIAETQKTHAAEKASQIHGEITAGGSLESVATSHGLRIEKPKPFTRVSNIPGIFPQSEFFGAALSLDEGEVSAPVETGQGYFIIRVTKKLALDEGEFEEVRESLRLELLQKEQQRIYVSWVDNLKERSTVKDHRRRLF